MLFEINKNGLMNITFDNISFFKIDLNKLSITDQKLILLLISKQKTDTSLESK